MRLVDCLSEYTRDELYQFTRDAGMSRCSTLRKAQLIDKILEHLCSEYAVHEWCSWLLDPKLNLIRSACECPISIDNFMEFQYAMELTESFMGYFEEDKSEFTLFDEIARVFRKIDNEDFGRIHKEREWMNKCIMFSNEEYGIVPLETFYEIYSLKGELTIDELRMELLEAPRDITQMQFIPKFVLKYFDMDDVDFRTEKGVVMSEDFQYDDGRKELLSMQAGKAFYVPSVKQIEEISIYGYEKSQMYYKWLENFMMKTWNLSKDYAMTWCRMIWKNSINMGNPANIINELYDCGCVLENDRQAGEFLDLLTRAHNNTRMRSNRGHTPDEQRKLSSNSSVVFMPNIGLRSKISRNSSCPCGSGKKYKHCCGKN